MGLSVQTVAATHAPDHGRGDAFGIRHRFVGRHVGLPFFRRDRTVGLPLFRRTLVPTELPALHSKDPARWVERRFVGKAERN
jgi:hypothetical protein